MKKQSYKEFEHIGNVEFVKDSEIKINPSGSKHRYAFFKCKCGNIFEAYIYHVKKFKIVSCGCTSSSNLISSITTHGKSKHKLYAIHRGIIFRTSNISSKSYVNYGGRGITVCDEWRNDFMSFYDWAIENGYKDGLSIDRIDNDGNYEPSNCRWVGLNIQAQNSRVLKKNNSSGYRGVGFGKNGKFISRICNNGVDYFLGVFNDKIEAANAYDNFVILNNLSHSRNFK